MDNRLLVVIKGHYIRTVKDSKICVRLLFDL